MPRHSPILVVTLALALAACGGTTDPDAGTLSIRVDHPEGAYPHKVGLGASLPRGFSGASVTWDMGDGSSPLAGESPYHVYWAPGAYDVVMRARAADGGEATATTRVVVTDPVPREYKSLYEELTGHLRHADERVSAKWDGTLSGAVTAAWNLPANSHAGDALLDPGYYDVTVRYLDALAGLGVKAIVVEANYPSLTPTFNPNYRGYVDYFRRLGDEVRARGLRYVVEQNSLLPGYSALPVEAYYQELKSQAGSGKVRWGRERYEEALVIMGEIKPDYFVLVEEPTTHDSGLGVTLSEWVFHVDVLAAALKEAFPASTTKLGAGSGTWEDARYTQAFAASANLDFVELHMYPLASPSLSYFDEMLERLDMVKSTAPGKALLTVEGWPYKAKASELAGGMASSEVFARGVYGFWAPLDQRFLEINAKIAHHYGFAASGPAWSRYFFAYLDHGDTSLSGRAALDVIGEANRAAGLAMLDGKVTSTGRVFKDLGEGKGLPRRVP